MKFPKTVYVHVESAGTDDEYLAADKEQAAGLEEGERRDVATYELKEINRVTWSKKVDITPTKRKS